MSKDLSEGLLTDILNRPAAWSAYDLLPQQNLPPSIYRFSAVDFFIQDLGKQIFSCWNRHIPYHGKYLFVCVALWLEELIAQSSKCKTLLWHSPTTGIDLFWNMWVQYFSNGGSSYIIPWIMSIIKSSFVIRSPYSSISSSAVSNHQPFSSWSAQNSFNQQ